jgi:hypothetical protein
LGKQRKTISLLYCGATLIQWWWWWWWWWWYRFIRFLFMCKCDPLITKTERKGGSVVYTVIFQVYEDNCSGSILNPPFVWDWYQDSVCGTSIISSLASEESPDLISSVCISAWQPVNYEEGW